MKKLTVLLSLAFSFVLVFLLASCSSTSGIKAEIDCSASTTTITVNMTFAANENITNGSAALYVKCYNYSGDEADPVGAYKQKEGILWTNNVYTSSSVTFQSLTKGTTYAFRLYATYKSKDEIIEEWTYATKDGVVEVATVEEFKTLSNDRDGDYVLTNDIDFNGGTLASLFTSSSTAFTGTFDGQGHTISNFTLTSSTLGIFSYTKDATIKNVNIVGTTEAYKAANLVDEVPTALTNADFTSGRSTANIGALVGTAEDTVFEDITVSNVIFAIKGGSSATLNVGGVVGSAKNCSFNNVDATNIDIKFTELKLKVAAGLFAGQLYGDSLPEQEDGSTFAVKDSFATGTISGTLYYSSSEGYAYVGGFVGDLGTTGLITNTYVIADITLEKNETTSFANKYLLSVGGFVGTNLSGYMYIDGCAAVADVKVYAGLATTEEDTLKANKLTNYVAYVGGFVGSVYKYINVIKNSAYFQKADGVSVLALLSGVDDESNPVTYCKVSNVIAETYSTEVAKNVVCYNDDTSFDTTVLGADVQTAVADYK